MSAIRRLHDLGSGCPRGAPILQWTMLNIRFASRMIWPPLTLLETYR